MTLSEAAGLELVNHCETPRQAKPHQHHSQIKCIYTAAQNKGMTRQNSGSAFLPYQVCWGCTWCTWKSYSEEGTWLISEGLWFSKERSLPFQATPADVTNRWQPSWVVPRPKVQRRKRLSWGSWISPEQRRPVSAEQWTQQRPPLQAILPETRDLHVTCCL